jgi:hypothetical protein
VVRRYAPQAKRSFARGVLGSIIRWAAEVARAVGSRHHAVIALGVFIICEFICVFVICEKMGFSPVIRGPLWLSPTKIMNQYMFDLVT